MLSTSFKQTLRPFFSSQRQCSTRINLWASPRTASTALMYSFAQRSDTFVMDEPLYAHYLTVTGADRPYRDEVLKAQEHDGNKVVSQQLLGPIPDQKSVLFAKNIAKQSIGLDRSFIHNMKNIILIRDPRETLTSWSKVMGDANLHDISIEYQLEICEELKDRLGNVVVINNDYLVERPEGTLRAICEAVGIDFQPEMLRWEKGGNPADGSWKSHWYHNVHSSESFQPGLRTSKRRALSGQLAEDARKASVMYEELLKLQTYPLPVLPDSRNENILVYVDGNLVHRKDAKVSVFDSVVQGGDAVWEGIRIYDGKIFSLDRHLKRLKDSAKAMDFERVPSNEEIKKAIFDTLEANGMTDNAHIRLTLTRGEKVTSWMSPVYNQSGPTLIVLAEWKKPPYDNESGIRLITSAIRRNSPNCIDSKIHHNNLINNILAKIQGNLAGVDDAIMLDLEGYVSETNGTNIFIIRDGVVITPHADYCLPGITREKVINVCKSLGVPFEERRVSLTEVHSADEVFTTGTVGELTPVTEVDGRDIGEHGSIGPVTRKLSNMFQELTKTTGTRLPFMNK